MTAIRVVIADDEPHARRTLVHLIAARPDLAMIGECRNGGDTIETVRRLDPQLLLLDVQMPGTDGFGVLRALTPRCPPAVILVTAYDEFAVRAFDAEVLDFLVKPFTDQRFHQAVDRVCRHLASVPSYRTRFVATLGQRSILVSTGAITWIEADDCYARVHTNGRQYLIREALTQMEVELDPKLFARVHRSAIVNLTHVREIQRGPAGQTMLVLRDGTRIPVSVRRRALVARLFG